MNKLLLPLLLVLLVFDASAQTAKISLKVIDGSKIAVSDGKQKSVIDLSEDVTGCPRTFHTKSIREGCSAPAPTFKLLDSEEKDNHEYLLILATAADNCNVCKRCGASKALTLIWLNLKSDLQVDKKDGYAVQDCMDKRYLTKDFEDEDIFVFKDDVLQLSVSVKKDYEAKNELFWNIKYDNHRPEDGIQVQTERKPLSVN